jgi:hypothetical protein
MQQPDSLAPISARVARRRDLDAVIDRHLASLVAMRSRDMWAAAREHNVEHKKRSAVPGRPRNPLLLRLSRWAGQDSNLGPTDYESAALTN